MKKLSMIALALVLSLSLAACGRGKNSETSAPTNTTANKSTFDPTIIPDMDPTLETNIPDPSVDTSMPMDTDITEGTDNMDTTKKGR